MLKNVCSMLNHTEQHIFISIFCFSTSNYSFLASNNKFFIQKGYFSKNYINLQFLETLF